MNFNFIDVAPKEIKEHFPSFYHKDDTYFEIIKAEQPIGIISVRPFIAEGGCNFGVFMTDKYKLTKNIVLEAFKIPSKLGFKTIFIGSSNDIVTNFLDYMEKFGIHYICNMFGKKYYVKYLKD
jgi:hypothetical protein